ncbi:hypothetical protein AcV5_008047 [Taiwanofungus camphoratus]|nr:hypothetical protein AcV5_008047 [Antrodia cinnamomea]
MQKRYTTAVLATTDEETPDAWSMASSVLDRGMDDSTLTEGEDGTGTVVSEGDDGVPIVVSEGDDDMSIVVPMEGICGSAAGAAAASSAEASTSTETEGRKASMLLLLLSMV